MAQRQPLPLLPLPLLPSSGAPAAAAVLPPTVGAAAKPGPLKSSSLHRLEDLQGYLRRCDDQNYLKHYIKVGAARGAEGARLLVLICSAPLPGNLACAPSQCLLPLGCRCLSPDGAAVRIVGPQSQPAQHSVPLPAPLCVPADAQLHAARPSGGAQSKAQGTIGLAVRRGAARVQACQAAQRHGRALHGALPRTPRRRRHRRRRRRRVLLPGASWQRLRRHAGPRRAGGLAGACGRWRTPP